MKKRTFRISAGVGACALAIVTVTAGTSFAGSAPAPKTPAADAVADAAAAASDAVAAAEANGFIGGRVDVPAAIAVPEGNKLDSVFKAKGVQIYGCTDAKWALIEPAATLTGRTLRPAGKAAAIHFRGPSWESIADGTLVEGTSPVSAPSATPNSIPQLLVTAKITRGEGTFGGVTFIQRLDTVGGIAPAGTCTAGDTEAVRYSAVYRFFKKA